MGLNLDAYKENALVARRELAQQKANEERAAQTRAVMRAREKLEAQFCELFEVSTEEIISGQVVLTYDPAFGRDGILDQLYLYYQGYTFRIGRYTDATIHVLCEDDVYRQLKDVIQMADAKKVAHTPATDHTPEQR